MSVRLTDIFSQSSLPSHPGGGRKTRTPGHKKRPPRKTQRPYQTGICSSA
ncbi:hypothetical protein HMPREF3038_01713 [Akkermansia sp. KLE1797]|nr:hypothetical protein HMPREF3038_01713 [Akkermansia sp. KLE1797]KXU53917.1 hypothetical protein HMPREF3039_01872 [Akkermansia sp. KLE1798]